jgi:hypothetical protein
VASKEAQNRSYRAPKLIATELGRKINFGLIIINHQLQLRHCKLGVGCCSCRTTCTAGQLLLAEPVCCRQQQVDCVSRFLFVRDGARSTAAAVQFSVAINVNNDYDPNPNLNHDEDGGPFCSSSLNSGYYRFGQIPHSVPRNCTIAASPLSAPSIFLVIES